MLSDVVIRFNRYIVECKSMMSASEERKNTDLIDTQWNVNEEQPHEAAAEVGFNRYIVECKF